MALPVSLRQRNRIATMRLVQQEAISMMEKQGFDATTIDQLAGLTGVSASTIFRQFGTKENLILWDEADQEITDLLTKNLARQRPIPAFRDAVVEGLCERTDPEVLLRRLKLIFSNPAIWSAAAREDRSTREELAAGIASLSGRKKPSLADSLVAAACLAALDVALDHWQAQNGADSLKDLINQAFDEILSLA
jgi:AcrR family transcriptional regulator